MSPGFEIEGRVVVVVEVAVDPSVVGGSLTAMGPGRCRPSGVTVGVRREVVALDPVRVVGRTWPGSAVVGGRRRRFRRRRVRLMAAWPPMSVVTSMVKAAVQVPPVTVVVTFSPLVSVADVDSTAVPSGWSEVPEAVSAS